MMIVEPETYLVERKEVSSLQDFLNSAQLELGGYAKEFTTSDSFSVANNQEKINIKLVTFDKDYLITDILSEIEKAGFQLPEAQDAFWFASQYPDVQIQYPVAFLHKPWIRPETGGENVLILRSYGDKRYMHMHLFDSRWYSHVRFAVISRTQN